MNQILITNDENGNSVLGIKPIARFFAVMLIVVALIFAIQSGYKLYGSFRYQQEYPKAELFTEKKGSSISLSFEDEVAISKIEYAWNNGNSTILTGIGRKNVSIDVEIPQGNNDLNVIITDVNGNKTKFESIKVEFSEDEDTIKPTISIGKGSTAGKLLITANDDRGLEYISYKWEDKDEVVINSTDEITTTLTQEIGVEKGTKKITITAVDKSGNKYEETKTIVGSTGAKISVSVSEGNFVVKVTSDNVITKIKYTHNEVEHMVENIPNNSKEFEFKVPLQEGANYLKINAFENDIMTEYKCKKTK